MSRTIRPSTIWPSAIRPRVVVGHSRLFWLAAALLSLLISGCTTTKTETLVAKPAAYAGLQTYAWEAPPLAACGCKDPNMVRFDERVRAAVEAELNARGYRKIATGEPDFLADYRIQIIEQAVEQGPLSPREYQSLWQQDRGRIDDYGPWDHMAAQMRVYRQGHLLIGFSTAAGDLFWAGKAERLLEEETLPDDKAQRLIKDAVAKILAEFPER